MKLTKITEGWIKNEEESLISHYTAHLRRLQEDMAEKAIAQITDQKRRISKDMQKGNMRKRLKWRTKRASLEKFREYNKNVKFSWLVCQGMID